MKYMVMECHDAYAILMDEDSCFVHAANLNYKIGQIVTDPILMKEEPEHISISRSIFVRTAAIAASLVLISTAGLGVYSRNFKTQSVVTINSDLMIEMELNSKGKVLRVHSNTDQGQEVLRSYSGKTKDSALAANEILQLQIEHGFVADGDTVDLLIDAEDPDAYSTYKKELEQELSDLKLNVNVQNTDYIAPPAPPAVTAPAEPPAPPKDEHKKDPEPPKPSKEDKKPEKPTPPEEHKPGENTPAPGKNDPPTPPAPPEVPKDEPAAKPDEPPVDAPAQPPSEVAPPDAPKPDKDKMPPHPLPPTIHEEKPEPAEFHRLEDDHETGDLQPPKPQPHEHEDHENAPAGPQTDT